MLTDFDAVEEVVRISKKTARRLRERNHSLVPEKAVTMHVTLPTEFDQRQHYATLRIDGRPFKLKLLQCYRTIQNVSLVWPC